MPVTRVRSSSGGEGDDCETRIPHPTPTHPTAVTVVKILFARYATPRYKFYRDVGKERHFASAKLRKTKLGISSICTDAWIVAGQCPPLQPGFQPNLTDTGGIARIAVSRSVISPLDRWFFVVSGTVDNNQVAGTMVSGAQSVSLQNVADVCLTSIPCNPRARYRSFDGSCNNLQQPGWGSVNTALVRLLPAAYQDGTYKRAFRSIRRTTQRSVIP